MTAADRTDQAYLPIEDYAVIGDCHTCALVSRNGSIDWYCPERFDSSAVFCRILDSDRGGYLSVRPTGEWHSTRRYLDGTNVLETTFDGGGAQVIVTDFMPVDGNTDPKNSATTHRSRIVRRIEVRHGDVAVQIRFKPTFDYARSRTTYEEIEGNGVLASGKGGHMAIWCNEEAMHARDDMAEATLHLHVGDVRFVSVVYAATRNEVLEEVRAPTGAADLEHTRTYWEQWSDQCTYRGRYRDQVVRSALVLKLLTYAPSGGIVAAPTTSLPEWPGGVRNWDYRFTWLRDSSLILYAVVTVGYQAEAAQFLEWLTRIVGPHLRQDPQIMYTVDGRSDLPERTLDHLDGFRHSRPVRIGNGAAKQRQLDIYGEVLMAAYIHFHNPRQRRIGAETTSLHTTPSAETWNVLRELVEDALREWQEPDNGIWEVRGGMRHFLYSKLMCWAAVDRGVRLAQDHDLPADLARWQKEREAMRHTIEKHGYNKKMGAFVQSFDSDVLDAAALVIPRIGFLPATDPRVLSTVEQIQRHLVRQGYVYRYLAPDGLPGREGAFLLTTLWLVEALTLCGKTDEARKSFEHVLSLANDVGLYSEEVDPATGAFLGNFPQGFTHLSILRAAVDFAHVEKYGPETEARTEGQRAPHARHAAAEYRE